MCIRDSAGGDRAGTACRQTDTEEEPGKLAERTSQSLVCQVVRRKSAESAALCPSDMMLCVISYWVLSGAKWRQIQQLRCCALSRQAVEMKEASAKPYTKIRKK